MKLTEAEASRLAQSLLKQMRLRRAAMNVEASATFGVPLLPMLGVPPKPLSAAILILFTGKAVKELRQVTATDLVEAFGALSGMAKTWRAYLESPSAEMIELEAKYVVAGEMRAQMRKASAPSLKRLRQLDRNFENAQLKPALRAAYMRGQGDAAAGMLDEAGELRDDSPIRSDICFFIWLYWPEIQFLDSTTQLAKFFADMRQDSVTKKNLEKICREIGLKFKGRGRPENLFSGNSK